MLISLALGAGALLPRPPTGVRSPLLKRADQSLTLRAAAGVCRSTIPACMSESGDDWRDVRAKLVASERGAADSSSSSGYVYESPLIEQGTVLLDAVQDTCGFALHQQYFHKSVMLLTEHDEEKTKGIILNRPSALQLHGWRAWFGGDVAEGGFFRGGQDDRYAHPREVVCLHALESEAAARLSLPVIRGVSQTSLEAARHLVEQAGHASLALVLGHSGERAVQVQVLPRAQLVVEDTVHARARSRD